MTCTDPEIGKLIGSYELGLLDEEEQRRFEAHLQTCHACFRDLYDMAPIAERVRQGPGIEKPAGAENTERTDTVPAVPLRATSRGGRFWTLAVAGVAAVLIVGFFAFRTLGPWEEPERFRSTEQGAVVVFAPLGEVPTPTELQWKVVPGAGHYEVTIQTQSGELLWRERIEDPPARLPDAVRDRLQPGETYFWEVEALSEDGARWTSGPTRFTIWK
jgi:hypothetical protein